MAGSTPASDRWRAEATPSGQIRQFRLIANQLLYFGVLAAAATVLRDYQLYLNQWLQICWRHWMTKRYLAHWLEGATHHSNAAAWRYRRQS